MVEVAAGQFVTSDPAAPYYPSSRFEPEGDTFVVELGPESLAQPGDLDHPGNFPPGARTLLDRRSPFERWIAFLDSDDHPDRMAGERVGRVFLDPAAARA